MNRALGVYTILEKLGEGGMGEVFRARHERLGRLVALKVIRADRLPHPDAVRRFLREARVAAQLHHPNVVTVFDANEADGVHFLAMELVDGTDLAKQVKDHGPLPPALACEYVRQAALGLQHAHEKGLVHRDVKPSNLIVLRDQPTGPVVKVLDFGLARFVSEQADATPLTSPGGWMGTP